MTERILPKYSQEKDKIPDRIDCPHCGLKLIWFWFNSDDEEFFPSRWVLHRCLCEIIEGISTHLNLAMADKEKAINDLANPETRKNPKRVKFLGGDSYTGEFGQIKEIEKFIEEWKSLLKNAVDLKMLPDPNSVYLRRRIEIARKHDNKNGLTWQGHHVWRELFDCNNEDEARELLGDLYSDGSDKFIKDLEKIREEIVN